MRGIYGNIITGERNLVLLFFIRVSHVFKSRSCNNIHAVHDDENVKICPHCGSMIFDISVNRASGSQESYDEGNKLISVRYVRMKDRSEADEKFYRLVEGLKNFKPSR